MPRLMRWLSRRRLRHLHALGSALGWIGFFASGRYRRRLLDNAAAAGIGRDTRRASVGEAGRLVAELPWLWLGEAARPIEAWVHWQDDALIEEAVGAGRGLVLLTPHLGSFEVCAQAYAERFGARRPMTALYRPARQAWLRELERTARDRPGLATAPATLAGVRQMLRALKRGDTVGLLPDQVPPDGLGLWAPFFGRPAYTMTLASRLVQQTGAALLLMWAERLPAAAGWRLRVSRPARPLASPSPSSIAAPTAPAPADDAALQLAGAAAVNAEMERLILQCPAQYLWGYNRYKAPRRAAPSKGDAKRAA